MKHNASRRALLLRSAAFVLVVTMWMVTPPGALGGGRTLPSALGRPRVGRSPTTPGDLDPTFGSGGKVITAIDPATDWADTGRALVVQPDGKLVVAGFVNDGLAQDLVLVRYQSDGSLDTGFGSGGKVVTNVGSQDEANALAIQPEGKLVVAGAASHDFAVVRYQPDGALDTSFDLDGKVTTPIGSGEDWAEAIAIQPDGKIVVAGFTWNGSDNDFAVVRYETNGSLDSSFGSGGKVTTNFGFGDDGASAVVVQADGKVVAAGFARNGNSSSFPNLYDLALVRYLANGGPDATFGTGGKVLIDFGANDSATDLVVQPDGKLIAARYTSGSFLLVRLQVNGTLDTGFGSGGKVVTDFALPAVASAVALQADGRIVAAGSSDDDSGGNEFALARYTTNGSLDTSFGSEGKLTTNFGGVDVASAIKIQADGKLVAAGSSWSGDTYYDFAVARYLGGTSASKVYLPMIIK